MDKLWTPKIKRKSNNSLPQPILNYFYKILTVVENDGIKKSSYDWRGTNSLKKKLIIESDLKDRKIIIPTKVEFGSLYFKESNSKTWNFFIHLRHAFAHNYIVVENENIIKIALPTKDGKSLKLVCYLTFEDLKKIVSATHKTKKK